VSHRISKESSVKKTVHYDGIEWMHRQWDSIVLMGLLYYRENEYYM
jgi:hypothetical protein